MGAPDLHRVLQREESSLFGFFIRKFRLTYLILLAIIIMGLFSLFSLPREADPEVKIPYAVVNTVYPGATPGDVEDLVTNPIEDKIKNLENIRRYTSSSGNGFSSVFVEYEASADLETSIRKLKDAIDTAKPLLPADANDPTVIEIRANDFPIVTYSLVGDYSDKELKEFADILQKSLERIPSVSKVPITGGLTREYQVLADQERMGQFGVAMPQIVSAIGRNNITLPAGDISIDEYRYNVRVKGKFTEADALNDIVVTTTEDAPIYIRDVAHVVDTNKEQNTKSRIGFADSAPLNTVSLQIFKKTGGNIVDIVDESQAVVASLFQSGDLPTQLRVDKTNDNAVFIREDLGQLSKSGIQTMILIFVLLAVVIGFREAIITGLSVPIAFLMTFIALSIQGMTLNSIVLFALVLSLGLMVDNSIVIIEGINEYIDKHGKSPYEAALLSIWNYRWPIVSGTLTTVSAFVPMLLVSGIVGEYIGYMPKTITWTLLSSLFVALVVLPTLVSRIVKPGKTNGSTIAHEQGWVHRFIEKHKKDYIALLKRILPHKKRRRMALSIVWALFIAACMLPALGIMKVEMFPPVDIDYFVVNIKLPPGATLSQTERVATEAEHIVSRIPELKNYVTNLGTSSSVGMTDAFTPGGGDSENSATITVNLVGKDERERHSFDISEDVRPELEALRGGEVTVAQLSAGPPTGAPIEARVTGPDIQTIGLIAKQLVGILESIDGTLNVNDSIQDSTGEFVYTIDKQRANFYGLDIAAVAQTLRSAIYGVKASAVTINGEDVDITVKYDPSRFSTVDDLGAIALATPRGDISLKQIARANLEPSVVSINHRDGEKTVTVRSEITEGTNLQDVLSAFDEKRSTLDIPSDYSITIGGEVEDIQQSFREMFYSMILAVILIAFILVLQFNSFKQPFIILFSLPLAVIGVIFGLTVMRQPFGFPVFIGIVSLAGIAVNDAIVLIDKINKNVRSGAPYIEAIIDGGASRIQPILLTSLTTIAGIFPLIFANELWRGLSYTVIFGLIFSTILTLFIVPIMYTGMCAPEKNKDASMENTDEKQTAL